MNSASATAIIWPGGSNRETRRSGSGTRGADRQKAPPHRVVTVHAWWFRHDPVVAFACAGALAEQISCRYHDIRSHLARAALRAASGAVLRAAFGAGARARLMVKCGRVLRS